MKISVFTSNQPRHLSLLNRLAEVYDEVYAVIEVNTIFPGATADFYAKSPVMQAYFEQVMISEKKIFGDVQFLSKNVIPLVIKSGDLNKVPMPVLKPMLDVDQYLVFGASYIKGALVDFLVENSAYNIHMGMSPYYRGASCNFWAAYEGNYDLVGATIHLLSKGLDSGPMLFHAAPADAHTGFNLGMQAVKSAHDGFIQHAASGDIKNFPTVIQDKTDEIRYARYTDFTDEVALDFLQNQPDINLIQDKIAGRQERDLLNLYTG